MSAVSGFAMHHLRENSSFFFDAMSGGSGEGNVASVTGPLQVHQVLHILFSQTLMVCVLFSSSISVSSCHSSNDVPSASTTQTRLPLGNDTMVVFANGLDVA